MQLPVVFRENGSVVVRPRDVDLGIRRHMVRYRHQGALSGTVSSPAPAAASAVVLRELRERGGAARAPPSKPRGGCDEEMRGRRTSAGVPLTRAAEGAGGSCISRPCARPLP